MGDYHEEDEKRKPAEIVLTTCDTDVRYA